MKDHIESQTQKTSAQPLNQHLSTFARNHARTRNGSIPGDVDVMGHYYWLKNHDALVRINPFVWLPIHTQKAQRIRNFKHTREHDDNNKDPFERTICKIGHDAVSVPNQKQPKPTRKSTSKETTRTAQNNPNTPSKSTNQIAITKAVNKSLHQHHLQLTFARHKTNAFNKMMRFDVPSEIMFAIKEIIVATQRDKPHDRHKSP